MRLHSLTGHDVVVHTSGPSLAGRLSSCRRGVLTLEDATDLDAEVRVGRVHVNAAHVVMVQPVKAVN